MKLRFAFFGLLTLLTVSCSYEETFVPEDNDDNSAVEFYATIDEQPDVDTKVYADDQLRVLWNADDRITIFNKYTYGYEYYFKGEDGDTAGAFGKVPNDDFVSGNTLDMVYAVYPHSNETKINNDGIITLTLPTEQTYKDSSFGIGANTMVSKTKDNQLRFKNVGGYLSLKFYGEGVSISSITLKGNNGELLAGKCTIDMSSGLPVLTMDEGRATDTITLVCDPTVDLRNSSSEAIAFWFVLPPVTFSNGITVTVTTSDGGVFEKSTSNKLEIGRSAITKLGALEVVPNYDNVFVEFEDENFKAYCVENFDTNGDGEVSLIEAEKVMHIEVLTNRISSLQGIEFFSNLISLSCRGAGGSYSPGNPSAFSANGRLETLDVSNNKFLEHLECSCNNINQLDLSGNHNLTYLDCDMNPMTCLSLGSNSSYLHLNIGGTFLDDLPNLCEFYELEYLNCRCCNYRSIDVSHMVKLTYLDCCENQLFNLDISNNTALEYLDCSYNYLGTNNLDLSKNTLIKKLLCDYNGFSSLDVSMNLALEELSCYGNRLTSLDVGNNSSLTMLSCSSNRLTRLDVSNNSLLQWLFCDDNLLTVLYVGANVALRDLICSSNQITTLDVSHNTTLEQLYCENNPYLTEIWLRMGQTIEDMQYDTDIATIKYKGIENVVPFEDEFFKAYMVENFDADSDGEISFDEALLIEEMSFYTNYISSIKGIEYCKHLKNLYCVGPGQFDYIYGGDGRLTSIDLSGNSELTRLNCSGNQLESLDISNNSQLNWLECYGNKLTDLDVSCNTLLEYLDCSPMNDNSGNNLLASLYIASGQSIPNITVDRDYDHIAYNTHIVVMPEAVDLGLSVKWASFNIGATKPEEFGDYYAWGELEPRETFSYDYKWYKSGSWGSTDIQFSKYNTSSATLEKEDDIANYKWGNPWRMPTYNEQTELRTQCDWTYAEINGVTGWKVQSRTNGNSIFLPDAGNNNSSLTGSWRAQYWSSTLYPYSYFTAAYCLEGIPPSEGDGDRPVYYSSPMRCSGLTVRAVQD